MIIIRRGEGGGSGARKGRIIIMVLRHSYYRRLDYEKEEQRRRAKKDLEGTELTLLEASLVGLGGSALWVSGTGRKLLRCTMARLLPESAGHACLAGAVAGALTATGLWSARRTMRSWDTYHDFLFPGAGFASLI